MLMYFLAFCKTLPVWLFWNEMLLNSDVACSFVLVSELCGQCVLVLKLAGFDIFVDVAFSLSTG